MKRLLLFLVAVFSIAGVFGYARQVYAAGPACYKNVSLPLGSSTQGAANLVDCNTDPTFQAVIGSPTYGGGTITAYANDHCYTLNSFIVVDTPAASPASATQPSCSQLSSWAQQAGSTPAKCYSYDADSLSALSSGQLVPDSLSEADCNANNNYYKNVMGNDIPAGRCVVFSKQHTFLEYGCSALEQAIQNVRAGANQDAQDATKQNNECFRNGNCSVNQSQFSVTNCQANDKCDFVGKFLNPVIKFLAGGVGFVIVIVVIIAGIRYSASGGDPQKAAAAKKMIANAILAMVTYLFLYAILRWLLPGNTLP